MSKELVLGADKALSLLDNIKVLEALGKTAGKAAELAAALHVESIWDVLETFAKNPNSEAIKTAFDQVKLSDEYKTLRVSLPKLIDELGKYKALLKPLNDLPMGSDDGKFVWSVSKDAQPIVKADGYALNLGASAALEMDAGAAWDGEPARRLLHLGADGKLSLAGSATVPFSLGSVVATVGASTELKLDYFFKPADTEIYAVAAARCVAHLQDPFDLNTVFTHMSNSELDGLIYEFDNAANAEVKVSLADALSTAGGNVKVNVGAEVTVSAKLQSSYVLSLHKIAGPPFAMAVKLTRNPVETAGFSASLGVDVDISKLVQPVLDAVKNAATEWDRQLSTIKPFLSPGTWLQDQIAKKVDDAFTQKLDGIVTDPALKAALINDLNVALGVPDAKESLQKALGDLIGGVIDRNSALVGDDLKPVTDKVIDAVKAAAPALGAAAGTKLDDLVKAALQKADDALKTEVNKLVAQLGTKLAKALEDVGAKIDGAVGALDNIAALKYVRDLLAKVDDNVKKILASVEKALQQKISARFYLSETSTSGTLVEIVGTVTAAGPASVPIFDALMGRKLQPLIDMVVSGKPGPANFVLSKTASKVTRFDKHHSESGVEVVFLGIDLKGTVVADANATSIVDGFGNVYVNTTGKLKKTFSSPWDTREVSFVDTVALAFAGAMQAAGSPPVIEAGVSASYLDTTLDWNDVDDFIKGLADAKLVSGGAAPAAKATVDAWTKAAGGTDEINGGIAAALRLSKDQIDVLLNAKNYVDLGKTTARLTDDARKAIVTTALRVLRNTSGAFKDAQFESGCKYTNEHFTEHAGILPEVDVVLGWPTRLFPVIRPPMGERPTEFNAKLSGADSNSQGDFLEFLQQAYGMLQLVDLMETMGAVYYSKATANSGWQQADYDAAQKRMVKDCRDWITVAGSVTSLFKPDVTPRTIAFMRALSDLSGVVGEPNVQLKLTYNPKLGETKLATFM